MKLKKISIAATAILLGTVLTSSLKAQKTDDNQKPTLGQKIKKTASNVGNKTAELSVKGANKVAGKTYKGYQAPDGSDVYIDKNDRKYYVNKKGKRIYLKKSQIRKREEKKD
ncbi:MAG: hypothetical protein LBE82_03330 [Chitinophagaceae bacterium]|jgi:hypothetical protein|nr:hypothetical protein [Chitinophagaceae bacterium]